LQTKEALHFSFVRRNQTTFRTSNARTSLYPRPAASIPLHPPSPLPNIPHNSSRPRLSAVLLFYTDQMNTVHSSEEAPRSFTMTPCVVVEKLEGKQWCSRGFSKRARRNPSPRMIKVTVHEKRRVNEEQPTPASSTSRKSRQRGAQTTPAHLHWCGANPPSSWLAQAASSGVDALK